jgi:predicted CoA-binding protein
MQNIQDILNRKNIFAVVGATDNKEKYGYKIYTMLKKKGYTVYPVNPNRETVDGDTCYKKLSDLPVKVNVASVVTPPEISSQILDEAIHLKIDTIWFQPGAEDNSIIKKCSEGKIKCIYNQCLLIAGQNI